jgi:hypothetical protein
MRHPHNWSPLSPQEGFQEQGTATAERLRAGCAECLFKLHNSIMQLKLIPGRSKLRNGGCMTSMASLVQRTGLQCHLPCARPGGVRAAVRTC